MPDFPVIDTHVHLANPDRLGYAWMKNAPSLNRTVLPRDLKTAAIPAVVEGFVFVEVDVDLADQIAEAEWVDSLGRNQPPGEPKLKGMVASLPIERGKAIASDLDKLAGLKSLRGIRRLIQGQSDPDFCIRPDFINGLKLLAPRNLVFDICVYHHQLPNVIRMVRACPEVRFILDHIGKPAIKAGEMEPWRQNISELARCENVWCKISGVVTEADHKNWTREQVRPYIEHAINAFGFDRAMFGGDWHVLELAGTYPGWVEVLDWVVAGASASEKRKLYRDNAIAFYGLDR